MGNIVDFKLEFNNQLYFVMDILGDELRIPLMRYDYDPIDRLFGAICNLSPSGVRFSDVATVYKYGIGGFIRDGIPSFGCIKDYICVGTEGTIDDNEEQFSANPIYIYVPYKSSLEWTIEGEDVETIKWSLENTPKGYLISKCELQ